MGHDLGVFEVGGGHSGKFIEIDLGCSRFDLSGNGGLIVWF